MDEKAYETTVRSNESIRDRMDGRLDEPLRDQSAENKQCNCGNNYTCDKSNSRSCEQSMG
jgi:hypothetical protein